MDSLRVALVAALLVVAAPLAAAAETTPEPSYRQTGQIILYLVLAGIAAGVVGSWWVARRYDP